MNWIDWTGTALGTLCFLMLAHLMKGKGHRLPGRWVWLSMLALMGGIFLTFSIVGEVVQKGLSFVPTVVIGGAMLFALFVALVDIGSDRAADKPAIVALALLPLLLVAATGPIADVGSRGVTEIHDGTTSQLGSWLGG